MNFCDTFFIYLCESNKMCNKTCKNKTKYSWTQQILKTKLIYLENVVCQNDVDYKWAATNQMVGLHIYTTYVCINVNICCCIINIIYTDRTHFVLYFFFLLLNNDLSLSTYVFILLKIGCLHIILFTIFHFFFIKMISCWKMKRFMNFTDKNKISKI